MELIASVSRLSTTTLNMNVFLMTCDWKKLNTELFIEKYFETLYS